MDLFYEVKLHLFVIFFLIVDAFLLLDLVVIFLVWPLFLRLTAENSFDGRPEVIDKSLLDYFWVNQLPNWGQLLENVFINPKHGVVASDTIVRFVEKVCLLYYSIDYQPQSLVLSPDILRVVLQILKVRVRTDQRNQLCYFSDLIFKLLCHISES